MSEGRQDWGTPLWIFEACDAAYGPFQLDAAATSHNALCPLWYDKELDGLSLPWARRTWVNPPYGRARGGVAAWVRKAEWSARWAGCRVVMLLDVVVMSTPWFQRYVWWPFLAVGWPRVVPLGVRLTHRGAPSSAPFPSLLIIWEPRGEA